MELKPIGIIHSPYKEIKDAPCQGRLSNSEIKIEVYPEYAEGLKEIEHVSHLIILYWGHLANRTTLQAITPFNSELTGVFACRSPNRPNPVAFCIADLIKKDGNDLVVSGVDAVDGSLLLDIKAYSSKLDSISDAVIGWHAMQDEECPMNGENVDG